MHQAGLIVLFLITCVGSTWGQSKLNSDRYNEFNVDFRVGLNYKAGYRRISDLDYGTYTSRPHPTSNFSPGIFTGFGLMTGVNFYVKKVIFTYDPIFRYDHVYIESGKPVRGFIIDQLFSVQINGKYFNYGAGMMFMNTNQSITYSHPDGNIYTNDLKMNAYRFILSKDVKKYAFKAEFLYHDYGMYFYQLRKTHWSANLSVSYRIWELDN